MHLNELNGTLSPIQVNASEYQIQIGNDENLQSMLQMNNYTEGTDN